MIDLKEIKDFINPNSKKNKINAINSIVDNQLDLFTKAISETEKHFNGIIEKSEKLSEELNNKLSHETDEKGVPTDEDLKIYDDLFDYHYNIYSSSDNLTALAEMKIVYLFKSLEINMKSLIHIAYPKTKTDDFYKWENMVSFFKSKELQIADINGYVEACDLRKVNNGIKHTGEISADLKKRIREFTDENELNSKNINLFYDRIRAKIELFLKGLANLIINDLYTYDEKRLNDISDDLIHKMDKKTITQFIDILSNKNANIGLKNYF